MRFRVWLGVFISFCLVTVTSCGAGDQGVSSAVPKVFASTAIWSDITSNIACNGLVDVESVIPNGVDLHSFELSLKRRVDLEQADFYVANGLSLEENFSGLLNTSETKIFVASDFIDPQMLEGAASGIHLDHDSDDDHQHTQNPHIWLDPVLVSSVLPALADSLVDELGLDEGAVQSCLESYQAQLDEVDQEIAALFAGVPVSERIVISDHGSFFYFADRYKFRVVEAVASVRAGEANFKDLQTIEKLLGEQKVRAVFSDANIPSREMEALAGRIDGVSVSYLYTDSLGDNSSGADNYVKMLSFNALAIKDSLKGE